ncbi:hypothetical protein F66182_2789 [Fusarium sp. NRRL 66182]|nr:hypothetical protein F66182_2789 [Fusarium sp. NRRL 66182]
MRIPLVQAIILQAGFVLGLNDFTTRTKDAIGIYKNPKINPFLQLDLSVDFPANVSTPDGPTALVPNREGGKVSGAFEADILPVGAAYERVVVNEAGENSFYNNRYIFRTADNETLSFEVDVILNYANNALHGFGVGKFATSVPRFLNLNYNVYIVEVSANFFEGEGKGQVYEIKSGGRRDGKPIKALIPLEDE